MSKFYICAQFEGNQTLVFLVEANHPTTTLPPHGSIVLTVLIKCSITCLIKFQKSNTLKFLGQGVNSPKL